MGRFNHRWTPMHADFSVGNRGARPPRALPTAPSPLAFRREAPDRMLVLLVPSSARGAPNSTQGGGSFLGQARETLYYTRLARIQPLGGTQTSTRYRNKMYPVRSLYH